MSDRTDIEAAIRKTGGTIEAGGRIRGGNLSTVAKRLGIARKTLHNRMKKAGLKGTGGRPKVKFKRRARGYATIATAAAVAVAGGAIILSRQT